MCFWNPCTQFVLLTCSSSYAFALKTLSRNVALLFRTLHDNMSVLECSYSSFYTCWTRLRNYNETIVTAGHGWFLILVNNKKIIKLLTFQLHTFGAVCYNYIDVLLYVAHIGRAQKPDDTHFLSTNVFAFGVSCQIHPKGLLFILIKH